jgi:zinc protease
VYAGVDPEDLEEAVEGICAELARLRDEPVAEAEVRKARNYAKGRLELRLEEGRHLTSWLGVQEALHERVLTLDEALSALDAVGPTEIQALAGRLFRDEALTLAVVTPPGHGGGLEAALRLP